MRDLSQTIASTGYKRSESLLSAYKLNIVLLALVVILALIYLFTVNTLATEGLSIKKLSAQISKLEDEHKNLELQNSTLQSVSTIQEESQQLNYVPATNIIYLRDDNYALK